MPLLYIFAAIAILGILFLIYCFVGFSRTTHHKSEYPSTKATGEHKQSRGQGGIYRTVLTTFALLMSATLMAQTSQSLQPNSSDRQQVQRSTVLVNHLEGRIDQLKGNAGASLSAQTHHARRITRPFFQRAHLVWSFDHEQTV